FAPPPPVEAESAQARSREQQTVGGLTTAAARKSVPSSDKPKAMNQARVTDKLKDPGADNNRAAENQSSVRFGKSADRKVSGPQRQGDTSSSVRRSVNE